MRKQDVIELFGRTGALRSVITLVVCSVWLITPAHSQDSIASTKDRIYLGGGRQGLTYLKYERTILTKPNLQTIVNFGLGEIPGEKELSEPATIKLMPELAQLIGTNDVYLELGIEPSINIYGKKVYMHLAGVLGIRYQPNRKQSLFLQAGYSPTLYRSYQDMIGVPYYAGVGINL